MSKSGGVTTDMIECITTEYKKQDALLNTRYKSLSDQLTPDRKKQLVEAQRAWIKFRDTNCQFYYDPDGGTLARVEANSCMLSTTATRAEELKQFLER